ncbi:hypothetical protein Tco_0042763 [Tanacetum coccineum]
MFWRERAAISWIMMGMGGDDGLGGGNDNEATNENVHEDAPLDVEANNEATVIAEGVCDDTIIESAEDRNLASNQCI